MCRFVLYLGPRTRLSSLIVDPGHSLIRQSVHSREREEPLNGDGFGVGWYANDLSVEPAVFRSITPAWNNRNLQNLARVVASDCVLAHVRAATQSSGVNEANCHPFRWRRYLCMHNGDIGDFRLVRRKLLASVCDEAFANVYGSTDSEHFFALYIDSWLGLDDDDPARRMARALKLAIERALTLVREAGAGSSSYLNVAIADGDHAVVSRFTDDPEAAPESLYWFSGSLYPELPDQNGPVMRHAVTVSSERLTADPGWAEVPPGQIIILRRDLAPQFMPVIAPRVAGRAGRVDPRLIVAELAAGLRRELPLVELRIETRGRDELGVSAALDDPALLHHEDQIGTQHGGQPVRDHDRRPAGERAFERGLHRGLGIRVEVRSGLVEHDEVRRLQQQPRNGEPLLLTAGETVAALADHGVEAVRKRLDRLQDLRGA